MTTHTTEAGFDLDKLAAIADRVDARGLFNASCDIRDWIQEVHTNLARRAPAPADERALFAQWKGYPLPELNADGNFDKDWLHREWVAFRAGLARAAQQAAPAQPSAAPSAGPNMYRKTALVKAEQFLPAEGKIPHGVYSDGYGDPRKNHLCSWVLDTKEGKHYLRNGDYICTGPQGEQWNVERSIFESTYELAAAPTSDQQAGAVVGWSRRDFIERIVLSVAEIPDRNSPEDQPEMMLVTDLELRNIITGAFERADEDGGLQGNLAAPAAIEQSRLDFMIQHEAWVAFGKDGESCRVFHRNEDGDAVPMLGWGARHWRHDPREAIDAARAFVAAAPVTDQPKQENQQ